MHRIKLYAATVFAAAGLGVLGLTGVASASEQPASWPTAHSGYHSVLSPIAASSHASPSSAAAESYYSSTLWPTGSGGAADTGGWDEGGTYIGSGDCNVDISIVDSPDATVTATPTCPMTFNSGAS